MHCPNQLQVLLILSLLDDYPKVAWRGEEKYINPSLRYLVIQ
jgi:hypothetical protein